MPPTVASLARQSVGAAFGVSGQLAAHGQGAAAAAVRQAATSAFDHGLSDGCVVAAAIALAGALLAAAFLPAQPPQAPGPEHHQADHPRAYGRGVLPYSTQNMVRTARTRGGERDGSGQG
jgi:hypothetical protein